MSDEPAVGTVGQAKLSLDAIRVKQQLLADGRGPTEQERERLRNFAGWGPLTPVFAGDAKGSWAAIHQELAQLLPTADLNMGQRSTYTAFYTPPVVVKAMWRLLRRLGFDGGTVLEAGCGRGAFMDEAPDFADMTGVDRDPTAAGIAQLLHPRANIIVSPLEKARLAGGYAAAVGNVPFGDVSVADALAPEPVKESLHNYFIWRILSELAPGGVAVLLTSRHTMDSSNAAARNAFSELAHLIGAIRLPNGGLGGGTDIVADILVLRRRAEGKVKASEADFWLAASTSGGMHHNNYWRTRPEMVLGTMRRGDTTRWGLDIAVDPAPGGQLGAQLDTAADRIVARATDRGLLWVRPPRIEALTKADIPAHGIVAEKGWEENTFHRLPDKRVVKVDNGRAKPVNQPSRELQALMQLRDLAQALYAMEADHDLPDERIEPLRVKTREAYEAYVKAFGPVNRCTIQELTPKQRERRRAKKSTALGADDMFADLLGGIGDAALATMPDDNFGIDDDPDDEDGLGYRVVTPRMGGFRSAADFGDVAALESYDQDTGAHAPAAILSTRQNRRVERPTSTDDPAEALAWSLDQRRGQVDLRYIAKALGRDAGDVPELLGDRIYLDPAKRAWVIAEEYLSGNVRAKLTEARIAADQNERYARNVAALEAVQPKWLEPHEILVGLGTPWIDKKYVEQFIKETLRVGATVRWVKDNNCWEVDGGHRSSPEATAVWGTADIDAYSLIEHALNNKIPVVTEPVRLPDGRVVRRNQVDRSMVCIEKRQALINEFGDWIWRDPDRADTLCHLYNHTYNARVARVFDGSHITVEGMAPGFTPYPHQLSYVARSIVTEAGLCAFPVGGGKTPTMGMVAMKLKQLGLIKKAMIAVPTGLLEQTVRMLRQLFPAAKILAAPSESISKNRRAFAARCATGDWDMVITSHTALESLKVSDITEERYQLDQQSATAASIREATPDGVIKRGMVKRLAKALDKNDKKIADLRKRKRKRDDGITFEMLGVDYFIGDEAHAWKNLALPCRTDGFGVKASKRATDLDMRLAYLRRTYPGRPVATLLTGTPISNTMMEIYVMLHYLMPDYLDQIGIGSADAFASAFVQFTTSVEVTVTGDGFQMRTRPAVFVNAPELRLLLAQVSDIRTREQLGMERREIIDVVRVVPPTSVQAEYSLALVARAEEARKGGWNREKGSDNMLKICTDGRQMATDPALVGLHDTERGKLDQVADDVIDLWKRYPNELQFVFCDVGTPNAEKGPQTYGRLRDKLVARGMPRNKIAFIHDARNDNEKAALMAQCRLDGGLTVIMGSSAKLGTGVNAQDRAIAGHDVDAPMVPALLEQRTGRYDRKGNRNWTVHRYRYVTEKTFDAYLWQMLHRKASFINQVLTGENLGRTIEDVQSDEVLSMAAIKASATGQQILLEKATIEGRVKTLRADRRGHQLGVERMRRRVAEIPMEITNAESELARWEQVAKDYTGDLPEDTADRLQALAEEFWRYQPVKLAGLRVRFGTWRDDLGTAYPLLVVDTDHGRIEKKQWTYTKGRALRTELEKIGDGATGAAEKLRKKIAELNGDLVAAREAAERPFGKDDELTALLARLDQINAQITAAALRSGEQTASAEEVQALEVIEAATAITTEAATVEVLQTLGGIEAATADAETKALADLEMGLAGLFDDVPDTLMALFDTPTAQEQPIVSALDIDLGALIADELERLEAEIFAALVG